MSFVNTTNNNTQYVPADFTTISENIKHACFHSHDLSRQSFKGNDF
jgi:hypothetical protein